MATTRLDALQEKIDCCMNKVAQHLNDDNTFSTSQLPFLDELVLELKKYRDTVKSDAVDTPLRFVETLQEWERVATQDLDQNQEVKYRTYASLFIPLQDQTKELAAVLKLEDYVVEVALEDTKYSCPRYMHALLHILCKAPFDVYNVATCMDIYLHMTLTFTERYEFMSLFMEHMEEVKSLA